MNFNKYKKRKTLASLLVVCVAVTSIQVVEATGIKPLGISRSKLKELFGAKRNTSLDITSPDIVNYDFSNYRIVDENAEKFSRSFYAVDTIVQLTLYNDDPSIDVEKIMDETEELINEYENVVSKTKPGSFTYTLNTTGEYDYSTSPYASVIHQLVDKSRYYETLSNGELDVTIEPVVKLWNINNGNTEVPKQNNIDTALSLVGYENFVRDEVNQKYKLLNGANVDFGAIGKGQLADIVKASLMSKGINSGIINLGGNIMTIGAKPGDKNWVVALQDPTGITGVGIGTVEVKNKSVVSSGTYQRYFMQDGVRYHHIMDTKTGYPSTTGFAQTTIISDRSIDCDALSTTTFLLGKEKGLKLIESLDGFESMFIDEDMNYYYSDDFAKEYNLKIYTE